MFCWHSTFFKLQFRPPRRHQSAHLHCYHTLHRKTDKSNFLSLLCVTSSDCFLHSLWTDDSLHLSFRKASPKRAYLPLATSEEQSQYTDDPESQQTSPEDTPRDDSSSIQHNGNGGKPGFISFYNPRNETEDLLVPPEPQSKWGRLLWLIGPTVLVSSFTLPPIYLRRIVSAIFEDSLLTGSSLCTLPLLLLKTWHKLISSFYLQTSSYCSSLRLSSTVESPLFFWYYTVRKHHPGGKSRTLEPTTLLS